MQVIKLEESSGLFGDALSDKQAARCILLKIVPLDGLPKDLAECRAEAVKRG